MKKHALISGCNGFVGKYLIDELNKSGYKVFGFDLQDSSRYDNITYTKLNILERNEFSSYIQQIQIDEIYHLAAIASTKAANSDPLSAVEANIQGSVMIYEACRLYPGLHALIVGSSEMYRIPESHDIILTEESTLESHSMYGVTKISAEMIGREYVNQYGCQIIFSRSFNHTGPGQAPSYVLSDWSRQCALIALGMQDPVITTGSIDISRDFLDVRDVVKAYISLMKSGIKGEVYNVATGNCYRLRDLLNILLSFTGRTNISIQVDASRVRKNDPLIIRGNSAKIQRDTGWNCHFTIEKTLFDLFSYWKEQLQ